MAVDPVIQPHPQYHFTSAEGKQLLIIDLPMLQSLAGVELNIRQTEVQLCLPGGDSTLISLPGVLSSSPEAQSGVAKFSRKRGQLTISWALPAAAAAADESLESQADRAEKGDEPQGAETADTALQTPAPAAALRSDDAQQPGKPTKAYGSLWNANSWHWEEKNCIEMLRDEVKSLLQQCMDEKLKHINHLSGASVLLTSISVDGEASFSLRRGKRILCYEVSVSFNWEVRDAYGAALGAKGKGKVPELTQEEETPQVSIEVSTSFSGGSEAKVAGEWMRRQGAQLVGEFLEGSRVSAATQAAEDARANSEADAARRKEERAKAEAALEATSGQRERLAVEQKQVEEARRVKPMEGAVQGSVWNANNWHWEEKPKSSWAHAWLQRKLEGLTVSLLGGLAVTTFSDVKVSGDASVSVRKGRPIALFQLRLECKWTVAESTAGVGEAQGTLLVPDFSSEDGAKSNIEVQAGTNVKKTSGQLVAGVRREGVPAVRALLAQFVEELGNQLDRSS